MSVRRLYEEEEEEEEEEELQLQQELLRRRSYSGSCRYPPTHCKSVTPTTT